MTYFSMDAAFNEGNDRILEGVCRQLQLSKTQYQKAVEHYEAIGDWLESMGLPLTLLRVYPQGSLPMGTTNKPLKEDEYDLDAVCELSFDWRKIQPESLVNLVAVALGQHHDYKKRLTVLPRCVRLTYAHQFHLDIVPACQNSDLGEGQIKLHDGNGDWKDSNSKKFIDWFEERADLYRSFGRAIFDFAEPLPAQESLEEKAPLKCAVQLIKRSRDVYFRNQPKLSPASIVLNTLCAEAYDGSPSVFSIVEDYLRSVSKKIQKAGPKHLIVINPVNEAYEDLGEKWDDHKSYFEFTKWINYFERYWQELKVIRGIQNIAPILTLLFDEKPTHAAIAEFCEGIEQSRTDKVLGIRPTSGNLTIMPVGNIHIRQNTFYGK